MGLLIPLASLFGLEADALFDQLKRNAIAYGAMAFFALLAIAFLFVAVHIALSEAIGPVASALVIAVASLIFAVAILIVLKLRSGLEKRRRAERRRSSETTALVTTAALSAVPMLLGSKLVRSAAIPAAVLGVIGLLLKGALNEHHDRPKIPD
jgi:hypothetical protein